jgi:peptide/nickel transport system substrate-binding protein
MPLSLLRAAALGGLLVLPVPALAAERLDVVAPWDISSLDPSVAGYAFLRMHAAETLVEVDEDGGLIPGLARDWSVSEDGLSWRFELREEVPFHDGSLLDAEAAAAALGRALPLPGVLVNAPIEGIGAEDGAVLVTLSEPFASLPALLTHSSTIILAPASYEGDAVTGIIGTGPFRVTSLEPPQSMELARFDGYWGQAPALAAASYLAASRAETRALLAETGEAGLVVTLDAPGFARLAADPAVEAVAVPIPRVITLKLNAAHPALAEPDTRRALSLAIDRGGIAAGILRFPEAGAGQLFPPILPGWHDPELEPLAHDPDEAADLLAALGWEPGPDGVLVRDGTRLALTLRTFPDRPELPLVAAALQDQWRAIGVDLAVSVGNSSDIPAGHGDGSLDLALYTRNYGITPDPVGTVLQDFGPGGGDWGAMNWTGPAAEEAAEALRTAAREADPAIREHAIDRFASLLHEELPVIPIAWYMQTVAHDPNLAGIRVDPLERSYGLDRIRAAE